MSFVDKLQRAREVLARQGRLSKRVVLIDFDRARESHADAADLTAELARLRRSARKLDPEGRVIREEDFAALRP